ncbi:pyrophosphate--fructose 6-phosphate1-phosphotransferase subunit beta, partial [Striga asiatica]
MKLWMRLDTRKKKLSPQCLEPFDFLPTAIQEQLMLKRDPHGNISIAAIGLPKLKPSKMLIQMVVAELEARKEAGSCLEWPIKGRFHFFGYFLSGKGVTTDIYHWRRGLGCCCREGWPCEQDEPYLD